MQDQDKFALLGAAESMTLRALLMIMSRDAALVPRVLAAFEGENAKLGEVQLPEEVADTRALIFSGLQKLKDAPSEGQREVAVEISHLVLRFYLELVETKTEIVARLKGTGAGAVRPGTTRRVHNHQVARLAAGSRTDDAKEGAGP